MGNACNNCGQEAEPDNTFGKKAGFGIKSENRVIAVNGEFNPTPRKRAVMSSGMSGFPKRAPKHFNLNE
jgi:hypothetical protein